MELSLDAYAKINLYLGVESRVTRGRHHLRSVFTTVSLYDSLHFCFTGLPAGQFFNSPEDSPNEMPVDVVLSADPALRIPPIATHDNIIIKAVRAFEAAYAARYSCSLSARRLEVTVKKRIPTQAGLGGGSADAAATLQALAQFCNLPRAEAPGFLAQIASQVGADVPFFLVGGCALMVGFGDILQECLPLPDPALNLALVKPERGVSTATSYQTFDAAPQPAAVLEPLLDILRAGKQAGQSETKSAPAISRLPQKKKSYINKIAQSLSNNLEPAAYSLAPELAELQNSLAKRPSVRATLLCGSGSTVFALCETFADAQEVAQEFAAHGFWSQAVQTCAALATP